MVAIMALMVAMFATAAYAATIVGTDGNDDLPETAGNDQIYGFRGVDTLDATAYDNDIDKLYGGRGPDTLYADDGDGFDELYGGRGYDICYGDPGDIFVNCQEIYT